MLFAHRFDSLRHCIVINTPFYRLERRDGMDGGSLVASLDSKRGGLLAIFCIEKERMSQEKMRRCLEEYNWYGECDESSHEKFLTASVLPAIRSFRMRLILCLVLLRLAG